MIIHQVFGARCGAITRCRAVLFVKASILSLIVVFAFGCRHDADMKTSAHPTSGLSAKSSVVTPIPFGELNDGEAYNASGVVPLDDSRFLFCDNHVADALYELDLTSDGQMQGKLIRRPLQGLGDDSIDDLEAMTLAEEGGRKFLFVTSSLCLKKGRQSMQEKPTNVAANGLLRVTVNSDHGLSAENMPGFRNWLIQHEPELASSATMVANDGGLNIEGLAWDHNRGALLFGVRTPAAEGKSMVLPVKVKNFAGAWTTDNLEALPPIRLTPDQSDGPQGIRSLEYIEPLKTFLVVFGNAVEHEKAPFTLYEWDGQPGGAMHRIPITFTHKMKPEGMTSGTIGGKPALLFVDDAGGFQAVGLDMIHP